MTSADREHLEPAGAGLEGAGNAGGDPDRVERLDLEHLVVELDPAAAAENDEDLLGLLVPVPERLPVNRITV